MDILQPYKSPTFTNIVLIIEHAYVQNDKKIP